MIGFDLRNELRGIPASVAQNLRLSPRGGPLASDVSDLLSLLTNVESQDSNREL